MPTIKQETPQKQGKPIFVGKSALVRLINDSDPNVQTIWFVDPSNKTLRPFVSESKFDSMFDDPSQARSAVVTLSTNELSSGGVLDGFKIMDSSYGVREDGTMKNISHSPSQTQERYGQSLNEDGEKKSVGLLDGLLSKLSGSEEGQNAEMMDASGNASLSNPEGYPGVGTPSSAPSSITNEIPPLGTIGLGGKGKGGIGSGTVYNIYSRYPYNRNKQLDGQGGTLNMYNTDVTQRNSAEESYAQNALYGGMDVASGNTLTPAFISSLKNNPDLLAFYIGALTYGGYSFGDIMSDMVRVQKSEAGDSSMDNISIISPNQTKSVYSTTAEGKKASTLSSTIIPSGSMMSVGNYDTLKNYTIYNMPEEFYKELVPTLDLTSPEYKTSLDNVKSAYYDIMSDIATAQTDQERTIAWNNLQNLQKQIKDQYGFQLSNNVFTAWSQLQNIDQTSTNRGIQGSGMENEEIDDYLAEVRRQNQEIRNRGLSDKDSSLAKYYQTYASSEEIAALSPEDRLKYGLTPDAKTLQNLTVEALKAKYPYLTDEEAQRYHDSILDANNNLYSSSYSSLEATKYKNASDEKAAKEQVLAKQLEDADAEKRRMWDSGDASTAFDKPSTEGQSGVGADTTGPNNQYNADGSLNPGYTGPSDTSKSETVNTTSSGSNQNNAFLTTMTPGSTSSSVAALQDYLRQQGYFPSTQTSTGYYGDITKKAVAAWQAANGVDAGADAGYWGPKSISTFNSLASNVKSSSNTSTPATPTTPNYGSTTKTDNSYSWTAPTSTPPANPIINAASNISNSLSNNQNVFSTTTPKVSTSTQPIVTTNPAVSVPSSSTYKIASGDTLSKIAAANKTTVAALAKLNSIVDPNKISAGATIKLK